MKSQFKVNIKKEYISKVNMIQVIMMMIDFVVWFLCYFVVNGCVVILYLGQYGGGYCCVDFIFFLFVEYLEVFIFVLFWILGVFDFLVVFCFKYRFF